MLAVRDLVEGTGLRVVAGAGGLATRVRWVHVSELPDPTPWLSGGELLLTTGMALRAGGAREYVARLAAHGLAGLGVGVGVGGLDSIPADMAEEASAHDFPLIEVPYEVPFIALTERAATRIVDDMRRTVEAHELLMAALARDLQGEELRRRLAAFGVRGPVAAVTVAPPADERAAVEGALAAAGAALVAPMGDLSCALLQVDGDDAAFAAAEQLRSQACPQLAAGAGRPVPPEHLRRTLTEARMALDGANGHLLATYRDLGSHGLLLSLQDEDALRLFCDSILSGLDGRYGDELMRSLDVFLDANGNWERAANRLNCHRHTLRYRVRRIEELTGRSLDSARDRIDFWLALRGRELLN